MESTKTISTMRITLQVKVNVSSSENNDTYKIASTDNDIDFNNESATWYKISNTEDNSNMQLESLISEIGTYSDEFLCCGKSSLQFGQNIYELDNISCSEVKFSINIDVSKHNAH